MFKRTTTKSDTGDLLKNRNAKKSDYSMEDGNCQAQQYKSQLHDWVQSTFKKKLCNRYVPSSTDQNICCCGDLKSHHKDAGNNRRSMIREWHSERCTVHEETDAYGEMEFQGVRKRKRAKFIRMSDNTDPEHAVRLLRKVWNMDYPQLLISVTGGAKAFKLSPKLKAAFTNGLLKVVQTTCTWVITGGTNTGVMKHVGEALQGTASPNIYCIGVACWGIVNSRKDLIGTKSSGTVSYFLDHGYDTVGASLDSNHSHFLLVDDGTVNQYGGEISFRGKLERTICNMKIEKNREDRKIPGVQLVLEGGPNTITTVLAALSQDPPMPVVVVKGSGRAADLLAEAHKLSQCEGPVYEMAEIVEHNNLLSKIKKIFPSTSNEYHQKIYRELLQCVENKDLITIYKLDEGGNIDEAILTAFLKGKHIRQFDQLDLAMLWNRIDIAKEIFLSYTNWTYEELNRSMYNALRRNRPEFVELLLENGVVIGKFLNGEKLEALYDCRYKENDNILKTLFTKKENQNNSSGGIIKLERVSRVIKQLMGGVHLRSSEYVRCDTVLDKVVIVKNKVTDLYFSNPFNELFIWAVLCNMNGMATMLWTHGDEPMAKALVARKLYQTMATEAEKYHHQEDIIVALKNEANTFGVMAIHLLNEAYQMNEELAGQLVTYDLVHWGNQTCMSFAVSSRHLEFVAHPCCQALLSTKWMGKLQFTGPQFYQVLLAVLFPPFVLKLGFKSLKDYKRVLMTEMEFNRFEQDERNERELLDRRQNTGNGIRFSKQNGCANSGMDTISVAKTVYSNDTLVESSVEMSRLQKYASFYNAPVFKFVWNVLIYTIFLVLYIYVITLKLRDNLRAEEWVLIGMVCSYATEEINQYIQSDAYHLSDKFRVWASNYWNLCDALSIILFFIGLGFRISGCIMIGHVIYAVDIMFWIIRYLEFFAVSKHIGPYIVMIRKMMMDMFSFFLILVVFMLAYGVSRYVILYPNREQSWKTIGDIVFTPYFQIFGELFLSYPDEITGNKTVFGTDVADKHIVPLVAIIMAFYLLIANVLLLNLLIAIFNNTYQSVQANSNVIWRFQRYVQITEYSTRSIFFPPFTSIINIYQILKTILKFCCSKKLERKNTDRKLKAFLNDNSLYAVMLFEERCLSSFLRKKDAIMLSTQEERLRSVSERIDTISSLVEMVYVDNSTSQKHHANKSKHIEDRIEGLEKAMDIMINKLSEMQGITKPTGNCARVEDDPSTRRLTTSTHPEFVRSMSEYPHLGVNKHEKLASTRSASPVSLPLGFIPVNKQQQLSRKSFMSLNRCNKLCPNDPEKKLYPNADPERKGIVKRAVYNFRKGSLRSEEERERLRRSQSLTEPATEPNDSDFQPRSRIGTFPWIPKIVPPVTHEEVEELDFVDYLPKISSSEHLQITDENESGKDYTDFVHGQQKYVMLHGSESSSDLQNDDTLNKSKPSVIPDEASLSNYGDIDEDDDDDETPFLHVNCRSIAYPFSNIKRLQVDDWQVDWRVLHEYYKPPFYISPTVSSYLPWVDPDVSSTKFHSIKFNEIDGKVNRISFYGAYEVIDGLPRNPMGRTGLQGRGLLCRFGPNHMQHILITRWKNESSGSDMQSDKLQVLVTSHCKKHSLPQGPCDNITNLPIEFRKLFSENNLEKNGITGSQAKEILDKMNKIKDSRELVFQGYVDDERNTDNAWIESTVYNYHDSNGDIIDQFLNKDLSSVVAKPDKLYLWKDASSDTAVYLSESANLVTQWFREVAEEKNACFE